LTTTAERRADLPERAATRAGRAILQVVARAAIVYELCVV